MSLTFSKFLQQNQLTSTEELISLKQQKPAFDEMKKNYERVSELMKTQTMKVCHSLNKGNNHLQSLHNVFEEM